MPYRDSTHPPRDAAEDFLFHLYRGSELLQENFVHEAKAEIEQALLLQPSDPKGQDLLGMVYFRLGLYSQAIAVYERLTQTHPQAIEPHVNLGLSYLKSGRPADARDALQKVVEKNPNHTRAWGYLGLALQRLGDIDRAAQAFTAGGHDAMARRLHGEPAAATPLAPSVRPVRSDGTAALAATERPPVTERLGTSSRRASASTDQPALSVRDVGPPRVASEMWAAVEAGPVDLTPLPSLPSAPRERSPRDGHRDGAPSSAPASVRVVATTAPVRAASFLREQLLVFPHNLPVALHQSGLVLVQAATGFVTRLQLVRSMVFPDGVTATALKRRMRGDTTDEPLGGQEAPLVEISGKGELVLAPLTGRTLLPIMPNADVLYLREEIVGGFELHVTWENGRVTAEDEDAVSMMLFRGDGAVVASLPERMCAIEVMEGRSATMRVDAVLGWVGRVVPRALPASEAPSASRGLVVFSGEGMVLLDGR